MRYEQSQGSGEETENNSEDDSEDNGARAANRGCTSHACDNRGDEADQQELREGAATLTLGCHGRERRELRALGIAFAMGVGILLDTFLVRSVLVPAQNSDESPATAALRVANVSQPVELRRRRLVSLLAFFVRRLLWTIPLVLVVMLATFALMRGSGGDPFNPPEGFAPLPTPLQKQLRDYYNLDSPWIVEFGTYVRNVTTLDFGPSLVLRGVTVDDVIAQSFPVTLELIAFAAALALPIGIALGLLAALRRNSVSDLLATSTASVLLVIPVFFVAYVLSQYPIFQWHIVSGGWDGVAPKILPSLSLALAPTGYVARLIRATVVETLEEDYVRTARAKGLRFHRIVVVHILRNSLTPLVAAFVPMLVLLVTGAFFVEQFFMIPGASTFFLQAAQARDYPMLLGLTVAMTVLILLANLFADTFLMALDPRLRESA